MTGQKQHYDNRKPGITLVCHDLMSTVAKAETTYHDIAKETVLNVDQWHHV